MALITTVGIDVGGERKGFHAVALTGGTTTNQLVTADVAALRDWCLNTHNALVIAIDAPCRWSHDGRMRACERELMRPGMHCFASPSRERAVQHPSNYYGWMLRGEALYQSLEPSHPLCTTHPIHGERCCLETFPHAITWHLRGGNAQARQKRTQRRDLLKQAGIDPLTPDKHRPGGRCSLRPHRPPRRQRRSMHHLRRGDGRGHHGSSDFCPTSPQHEQPRPTDDVATM